MKPWDFEKFSPLLEEVNPKTICEIGTHKGNTAVQMIMFLAPKVESLYYTGYDVFDFASGNLEFNRREYKFFTVKMGRIWTDSFSKTSFVA